jgi:hypothetical protein
MKAVVDLVLVIAMCLLLATSTSANDPPGTATAADPLLQAQLKQATLLQRSNYHLDVYGSDEGGLPQSARPANRQQAEETPGLPVWRYSPLPLPQLRARIKAYILANDNGTNRCPVTPAEIALWIDESNVLFADGEIQFDFDPSPGSDDWEYYDSTFLNTKTGPGHPDWTEQKAAGNALAAQEPDALTVFFRWGTGTNPTGRGESWTNYDFVLMGAFSTSVCGQQNIGLLAHEIGHQLALPHPFSSRFDSRSEAETHFIDSGSDPLIYEADGRGETPPDPYISTSFYQCSGVTSVTLDSYTFDLPVGNVMSYYYPDTHFGTSQLAALRQGLQMRVGGQLAEVVTSRAATELEGELQDPIVDGGWTTQQNMTGFLGRWSNDYHLLWLDGTPGQALSFNFIAPGVGRHLVYAGFTAAGDYGAFIHTINDRTGDEIDLYSTIVLPTGAVYLGSFELTGGLNNWRAEVTGANPNMQGSRYGYGLDYILLVPDDVTGMININAGLNDAWYNPATNGQGFLISVFPEIKQMFLAWFTYDTERPPEDVTAILGDPGHRWLTAQGPYEGDTANLIIFVTEGGVFDAAEPPATANPAGDGTMRIEFADCTEGLVTYEITSLGISGKIPIQRIVPDNISLCEALNTQ